MLVKEIMTQWVEMADLGETVKDVAQKMKAHNMGALPVCQEDMIVGIITDRDIVVRAISQGWDPNKTLVSEIMTPDVICCDEDNDITEAAQLMEEKQLHRLLVISSGNAPVGMISLADFALKSHDEHLSCELLERVSEPTQQ